MPKKGQTKARPPIGDPTDPEGFGVRVAKYLDYLRVKNYSHRTVGNRELYLGYFVAWCAARSLTRPQEVTRPILERYARYLYYYRREKTGQPLSFRSQHSRLVPVRAFFKWLARENHILYNPASELELPRQHKQLPRQILSIEEIERVMDQASLHGNIGIRDRAILELLYSTGLRRMEAVNLRLYDIDLENGTICSSVCTDQVTDIGSFHKYKPAIFPATGTRITGWCRCISIAALANADPTAFLDGLAACNLQTRDQVIRVGHHAVALEESHHLGQPDGKNDSDNCQHHHHLYEGKSPEPICVRLFHNHNLSPTERLCHAERMERWI